MSRALPSWCTVFSNVKGSAFPVDDWCPGLSPDLGLFSAFVKSCKVLCMDERSLCSGV